MRRATRAARPTDLDVFKRRLGQVQHTERVFGDIDKCAEPLVALEQPTHLCPPMTKRDDLIQAYV
jgi:hypothetical protein